MNSIGKKVLVIGSGGREHALCWKLSQSQQVARIFALPGSFGIGQVDKCENLADVDAKDFKGIANWCKSNSIDLVVVGPEDPLANGLGDVLQDAGIRCFGPGQQGAQIESDKKWAKEFMLRQGIPTARFETFTDTDEAKNFIQSAPYKALVVKASGLAAGKGVVVAANTAEACAAVDEILGKKKYGAAGETLVVEELLSGEEISVLAFVDSSSVKVMLPAQDHKRLRDYDEGPNTGGMGAYAPCPLISQQDLELVTREVLQRAVDGLRTEGIRYCGVLYAGLMLTAAGPRVLEFNCRFGDPETQVILPLLQSDLYEVMSACCEERLAKVQLQWRPNVKAVGVVMASAGYPETSTKGCTITGLPAVASNELTFHSGVAVSSTGEYLTNGGRVLIVVALREDLHKAAEVATKLCKNITFCGAAAQFRSDIAQKAFKFTNGGTSDNVQSKTFSLTYKQSGVDIDAGDDLVQRIKPLSRGTQRPGVVGGIGGFGGLFRVNELGYKRPVICEVTNGIGSKIKLALEHAMYESIGYDLLAMCANQVLEAGAEPVAFLDYIACGKLQAPVAAQIVKGIADGCRDAHCALLGGETAEMPSLYDVGKYDIAGYCMGVLEEGSELPRFERYEEGDLLIALPASGLHCCGFGEILPLLPATGLALSRKSEFGDSSKTLGQQLAKPTLVYVDEVLKMLREGCVKSIAHITSSLLADVKRILPDAFEITLDFGDLKIPAIFGWLAARLHLSANSILHNLNCGIGLVLVVPKANTSWKVLLKGAKVLGVLKRRLPHAGQKHQIEVKNFDDALEQCAAPFGSLGKDQLHTISCHRNLQAALITNAQQRPESHLNQVGKRLIRLPAGYKDPVLIMGTDGVGTKIKIAQATGLNSTVGIDLVAMCANDILCNGAEPLTFSSYYACGELIEDRAKSIIGGVVEGALQAASSLMEAQITEEPLVYKPKTYDLAGFAMGIAEHERILPRFRDIQPGDVLIGLPSSGVHSNGFSLVHAVMKFAGVGFSDPAPFSSKTFGEEFLTPTRIYVQILKPLLERGLLKALAHITGGGLTENIPRVLTKSLAAHLDARTFVIPPVFGWLAAEGNVSAVEMQRTYNCGLGMVLVVDPRHVNEVLAMLQYSERAAKVGKLIQRQIDQTSQVIVDHFESSLDRVKQMLVKPRKRVAVLISGSGTNLQALIDASRDSSQGLHSDVVLVISNKADVLGVERAKRAGIPVEVISHKDFKVRSEFDAEMSKHLEQARVDVVCLAGFMRVLSEDFVRKWRGKLINIHPSLLPKHPGLHVQQKALDAGDSESGCTVHFVDEGVDTGAIILQASVPIVQGDTVESLTKRIQRAEHFVFPRALRLVATEAVYLSDNGSVVSV